MQRKSPWVLTLRFLTFTRTRELWWTAKKNPGETWVFLNGGTPEPPWKIHGNSKWRNDACIIYIYIYHLVILTLCHGKSPFIIGISHLFRLGPSKNHGELLVITRPGTHQIDDFFWGSPFYRETHMKRLVFSACKPSLKSPCSSLFLKVILREHPGCNDGYNASPRSCNGIGQFIYIELNRIDGFFGLSNLMMDMIWYDGLSNHLYNRLSNDVPGCSWISIAKCTNKDTSL